MNFKITLSLLFILASSFINANAQMHQIYKDSNEDNEVRKICFYTATEGYVAFKDWIGYTTDGGKSFVKKFISGKVNFNGYTVNLTFGFAISGVKAFNKDLLIVYGDYGLVPTILYSTDQGNTFKVVFHNKQSDLRFSYMVDMVFPGNGNIGYAIDRDRVLKTTDTGLSWSVVVTQIDSYFSCLEAINATEVYAVGKSKILKSTISSSTWQSVIVPAGVQDIRHAYFLNTAKAWINTLKGSTYYTSDGGSSWILKTNVNVGSLAFKKIKFFDESNGFGIGDSYTIYKTRDGGKIWEPLTRDNNFSYLGYSHYDMQFWDDNRFWIGGGYGFLESTTNGGGTPLPGAYFLIDQSAVTATNKVSLTNLSRTDYTYQWFRNDTLISTAYHASYTRNPEHLRDTIKLVVNTGISSGSTTRHITLEEPVSITAFSPEKAGQGMTVTISGRNLGKVRGVSFGGVKAAAWNFVSDAKISATVSTGASGVITLQTDYGDISINGFTYVPPPVGNAPLIVDFYPKKGTPSEMINIIGYNLTGLDVTIGNVKVTTYGSNDRFISADIGYGSDGPVTVTTPYGTSSLDGFIFVKPPIITSFTPEKGEPGASFVITGNNFDPVLSKNIVQFGGVKAKIVSSSTNSIAVIVPFGSVYMPISVTVDRRTGYSSRPFNILFPNGNSITTKSFTNALDITTTGQPTFIATSDIDGDGKLDLITNYYDGYGNGTRCVIHRNIGTGKEILFDDGYEIKSTSAIFVSDIDGDGKNDILDIYKNIFKNTSIVGKISFIKAAEISGFYAVKSVMDLDGDGKPELIGAGTIWKNVSTPTTIRFKHILESYGSTVIDVADVNGDGKPDLICPHFFSAFSRVHLNRSTIGNPLFGEQISLPVKINTTIKAVDLDGDGKMDLVCVNLLDHDITILHNTSENGNASFDPPIGFATGDGCSSVEINDIDGDGLPDIVLNNKTSLLFFKNLSSVGKIKLGAKVALGIEYSNTAITIADLNGDGKADLIVPNGTKKISIFKNTVSEEPFISDFKPTSGGPGDKVIITGKNFSSATAVRFGTSTASFIINSATQITATLGSGGSGEVTVDNTNGTNSLPGFKFGKLPVINNILPATANAGSTVIITGENFSTTLSGNIVHFGLIEAIVVSATQNSITAIVPASTTFGPVSVTVNGFIAYSKDSFIQTFTYDHTGFNSKSFVSQISLAKPAGVGCIGDLDGDGKVDLITCPFNFSTITLSRNTSENGTLAFASGATYSTAAMKMLATADIDGDGKEDVISMEHDETTIICVRPNTSKGSTLTLGDRVRIITGGQPSLPRTFKIFDINQDGRNDILVANNIGKKVSILLNTSSPGKISFADRFEVYLSEEVLDVSAGDMNNDGLPDLVASTTGKMTISVLLNKSSSAQLIFDKEQLVEGENYLARLVKLADFDSDGRLDILCSSLSENFSILKNLSNNGSLSFDKKIEFHNLYDRISDITIADFDGDGKIDLAVDGTFNTHLYKNKSSKDSITFADKKTYKTAGSEDHNSAAADFDGDDLPDLVTFGNVGFLLRNQPLLPLVYTVGVAISPLLPVLTGSSYSVSPSLPTGLSFNLATGAISGTPIVAAAKATYIVTAINATGNRTFNVVITVSIPAPTNLRYTSPNVYNAGIPIIALTPTVTGTVTSYSISPTLPTGLSFNTTDGTISGTPTSVTTQSTYTVKATNASGNITFGVVIEVKTKLNFDVSLTNVTCIGSNNGLINITATTPLSYTATVVGGDLNKSYKFNSTLQITSLKPGSYNVCITVDGNANYEQCYTLVITEPKSLSVYSFVNSNDNTLSLQLEGGQSYTIKLNDKSYSTTKSEITLPLEKGNIKMTVSTDKECQGEILKNISFSDEILVYPNPFENTLTLDLGKDESKKAQVQVYNSSGILVFNKEYAIEYGRIYLDLSELNNSGLYLLKLSLGSTETFYKILKQ